VAHTYTLQRGETLQWLQDAELVGSAISADHPVGLWGGSSCLNLPANAGFCDSAHQQIPPVQSLGSEYAAVRYRDRVAGHDESPPWRLVGVVDGTTLTYLPAAPAGAPTTLMAGQVADFRASAAFVVRSQDAAHPFYLAGYMTGSQSLSPAPEGYGDPEFVNAIPSAQYLSKYTLFTDPTYPETELVLVRGRSRGAFADVTLDCAGAVTGWQPIDAADAYEYARVELVHNFAPQGSCDNGLHVISSAVPFGATVWGWGTPETRQFTRNVSYAYPAGASIHRINSVTHH
jgi:hypothetical protein